MSMMAPFVAFTQPRSLVARSGAYRYILRPCHTLEGYLFEYSERARFGEAATVPLLQAIKSRPYGRGKAELTGVWLHLINAWKMVRRRVVAVEKAA